MCTGFFGLRQSGHIDEELGSIKSVDQVLREYLRTQTEGCQDTGKLEEVPTNRETIEIHSHL